MVWLVFDNGTSGVKAAIMNSDGHILSSIVVDYPTHVAENGVVEQNALHWWEATIQAARQLDLSRVEAIALTGQMQSLLLLDSDGEPVMPVMLYSDTRAQAEAVEVNQRLGIKRLRSVTGNDQGADGFLAKCLWIQHHRPEAFKQATYMFLGAADYIAFQLTGAAATDVTTASSTGLLHLHQRWWLDANMLNELGINHIVRLFPSLVIGGTSVGEISEAAAQLLGLRSGIPVYHGPGDAGATTIGAGCGDPGRAYGYLGTSGWIAFTDSAAGAPEQGVITLAHPRPDQYIPVSPLLTAGGNLAWVRDLFKTHQYSSLIEQALIRPITPLLYLPYLNGERSPFQDPLARAAFIGINQTTNQADMYRAVLEGIVYGYRHALDVLLPTRPNTLILTGGGTRSKEWSQLFADVFGITVTVAADAENVGVRGALLSAMVVEGTQSHYSPLNYFPVQTTLHPNNWNHERYSEKYRVFREAYPALKDIFGGLR